ncbi:MAG: hypothetical protein LBB81_11015 [Treponema sp.]|jgi:hypothetical protein|nr:hypothetical protein [Treponema sp.]
MWDQFWELAINHYIFHALVAVAGIIIVLRPLKLQAFLEKYKKVKAGPAGIELETKDEPNTAKDAEQDGIIKAVQDSMNVINQRLDAQYLYVKNAVIQAGVSVVWGNKAPFVEVIKAGLLNIKLGENGNLKERMIEVIMGLDNGVEIYRSLVNEFIKANKEVNTNDFFKETMEWINRRLV